MKKYLYDYNICTEAERDIYYKQCRALEKNIPNLKTIMIDLEDVDGSLVSIYTYDSKKILVYCSNDIGAVYIKSDVDLYQFFPQSKNQTTQ